MKHSYLFAGEDVYYKSDNMYIQNLGWIQKLNTTKENRVELFSTQNQRMKRIHQASSLVPLRHY